MKSNILIPTDFSIGSLNLVKQAMTRNTADEVTLVFVCGIYLPDSITEMLFFSPSDILNESISDDFSEACMIIQNKYQTRITEIKTEIYTGTSYAAFSNFLQAHQIDEAYIPQDYRLKKFHSSCFDCIPAIQRSRIPVYKIGWEEKPGIPEKDLLAELFFL